MQFPAKTKRESDKFTQCMRLISLLVDNLHIRITTTRRDLFYQDVQIFEKQAVVDKLMELLVTAMGVTGDEMGAVAAQKGLMCGDVRYTLPNGTVKEFFSGGVPILVPRFSEGTRISLINEVDYVLVVEKEAVLSALARSKEKRLLITGKGFSDVLTRTFIHGVQLKYPQLPIFGFADFDPHGFMILQNFKTGGGKPGQDCPGLQLTTASILDFIKGLSIIDLTLNDFGKCGRALDKWDIDASWRQELQRMMVFGKKAELDVFKDDNGDLGSYIDRMCQAAMKRLRNVRLNENP